MRKVSRRDTVLAAVVKLTRQRGAQTRASDGEGFTTAEIADVAGCLRANCSAELNALVRAGLLAKRRGRPVRYYLTGDGLASTGLSSLLGPVEGAVAPLKKTLTPARSDVSLRRPHLEDDFDWGVGAERSLRDAVQQAKMALTYPPHGMHILLLGETGVGKSSFSEKMHRYAASFGVLDEDAPLVAFNCAEYASNPEILLDQLFGHARGAYTGAHQDRPGLVERADGGMLFLDEVHRLPPQGQEMLFHLLDYGEFRRIGETEVWRKARVLLVAATTESPESALLATFRRRIPVVIRLPALRDWELRDRFDLIYHLCLEEARSLGRPLHLPGPSLDILLFSRFASNIGELKNTLKLACARAYNRTLSRRTDAAGQTPDARDHGSQEAIEILPEHLVIAPADGVNRPLFRTLMRSVDMRVDPGVDRPPSFPMMEADSIYVKLDRLGRTLQELGFATEEILDVLERELKRQRAPSGETPVSVDELRQFVGESFYSAVCRAWEEIDPEFPYPDTQAAFLRVAMHLFGVVRSDSTVSTAASSSRRSLFDIVEGVRKESPHAYQLSRKFLEAFETFSGVQLPPEETAIVAMLFRPSTPEQGKAVAIVVALFGDSVATEMVRTALQLVCDEDIAALNIPVQTPQDVMETMLNKTLETVDTTRGVLLLTNVPRLAELDGATVAGGVPIRAITRPDLHTVVTALHIHRDNRLELDDMASWLKAHNRSRSLPTPQTTRVVWACCLTGKGTARAVERLIREALPAELRGQVRVVAKELGPAQGPDLEPEANLAAVVGSINPGLVGVPFFSVETLFSREGISQLLGVLSLGQASAAPDRAHRETGDAEDSAPSSDPDASAAPVPDAGGSWSDQVVSAGGNQAGKSSTPSQSAAEPATEQDEMTARLEQHVYNLLKRNLVFVNPDLALGVVREMWRRIVQGTAESALNAALSPETYARFCLHTAYVIERCVRNEHVPHPYAGQIAARYPNEWHQLQAAWEPVQETFRVSVHPDELAYLFELVFSDHEVEVFQS